MKVTEKEKPVGYLTVLHRASDNCFHNIMAGCHSSSRFPRQHARGSHFFQDLSDPPWPAAIFTLSPRWGLPALLMITVKYESFSSVSEEDRTAACRSMWRGCWLVDVECVMRTNGSWDHQLWASVQCGHPKILHKILVFSSVAPGMVTFVHHFGSTEISQQLLWLEIF